MLKPLFHYSFDDFCERYSVSPVYIREKLLQKYPPLQQESDLMILIGEVDLLVLAELGSFSMLCEDDIRLQAYIKINPLS